MKTCPKCGKETDQPPHTCLVSKTPETEAVIYMMDGIEPIVSADFARKLECERNEAKRKAAWLSAARNSVIEACVILPNVAEYLCQLETELNQLRKVSDDYHDSRVEHSAYCSIVYGIACNCGLADVEKRYNQLPHVIERNKSK